MVVCFQISFIFRFHDQFAFGQSVLFIYQFSHWILILSYRVLINGGLPTYSFTILFSSTNVLPTHLSMIYSSSPSYVTFILFYLILIHVSFLFIQTLQLNPIFFSVILQGHFLGFRRSSLIRCLRLPHLIWHCLLFHLYFYLIKYIIK